MSERSVVEHAVMVHLDGNKELARKVVDKLVESVRCESEGEIASLKEQLAEEQRKRSLFEGMASVLAAETDEDPVDDLREELGEALVAVSEANNNVPIVLTAQAGTLGTRL